jgi:hypothetical protein
MNYLNNYDKRVKDKKEEVRREKKIELLVNSRHVECNSLDGH